MWHGMGEGSGSEGRESRGYEVWEVECGKGCRERRAGRVQRNANIPCGCILIILINSGFVRPNGFRRCMSPR